MSQFLYYFIIKVYKGLFIKKHKGNAHILMVPEPEGSTHLLLGMLGEIPNSPGTYATQLVAKIPSEKSDEFIEFEKEQFGEKFVQVEKLPSVAKRISSETIKVKVGNGKHILSDLIVTYNQAASQQVGKDIYLVEGKFDLVFGEVPEGAMKSIALQKMSIIGGPEKFANIKQKLGDFTMEKDNMLEKDCKNFLSKIIKESKALRKKLSFDEQKKMVDLVQKMSLRELISVLFYDGKPITEQEEGKFKRGLKYGTAGLAGAYAGHKVIPKVVTKVTKRIPVPVPKGRLAIGAGLAMTGLYLWRRFSDKCRGMKTPKEVHSCKANAAQIVVRDLKQAMGKCNAAHDPLRCKEKVAKRISYWVDVYRNEREKAAKSLG